MEYPNDRTTEKKLKVELLAKIGWIDKEAEVRALSTGEWQHRYELENSLEHICNIKEIYWQQRVGDRWTIKGDSNTKFFHHYANGRRRKSTIVSLETENGEIRGHEVIMEHIVSFYKTLFDANPEREIFLSSNFWQLHYQLSEAEKAELSNQTFLLCQKLKKQSST